MQKPTVKEISRHWLTGCIIKLGHVPPTWTMELITNHWPPNSDSRRGGHWAPSCQALGQRSPWGLPRAGGCCQGQRYTLAILPQP